MRVLIEHLAGTLAGSHVDLERPVIRFGRAPENDVVFDLARDMQASARHAELHAGEGQVFLQDLGSTNGLYVNGRRVLRVPIANGDVVEFGPGGPRVRVTILDRAESPRATSFSSPAAMPPDPIALQPLAGPGAAPSLRPPGPGAGPPPSPGALAPGQKVGAHTVAMMINQALMTARARDNAGPVGRGTVFVKSMVEQAVTRSTRKFKLAVAILLLVILGGGGAAAYVISERAGLQEAERARLVKEIASLARESERRAAAQERAELQRERQDTQKRIADLTRQLARMQTGGPGADIAAKNRQAVYLLVAQYGPQESPFCTGFAVRASALATNAHCVHAAQPLLARGASIVAVLNGNGRMRRRVTRLVAHPGYRPGGSGYDVGLMELDGQLPRLVRLATTQELRAVSQGATMYTLGFPGTLAKPNAPEATITQGIVSRLMTPNKEPGRFEEAHVLQHTAYVTGGTSGSPIFDLNGTVIGINAGGLRTKQEVFIGSERGRPAAPVSMTMAAPGYNYGMRIDLLNDILGKVR